MLDDEYLIGQLKRGDQAALESIYIKYRSRLLATAFSYHVDVHQAEDVLHDVFLSMTYRICDFEIDRSLYGYLRTGIINGIRDIIRRRSRQEKALCYEGCCEEAESGPHERVTHLEEAEHAEILLSGLPRTQREVLSMRIHEGLKFREIAHVQGVSSSTVRGRYRYGISRLRNQSA